MTSQDSMTRSRKVSSASTTSNIFIRSTGASLPLTMSTEMAVVTTAQSKVVAMTDLSIKLYPIQKKRVSFLSLFLPSFIFHSSPSSTKRKVEIAFVGIEMSVLVFLFGVSTIAKPKS